MEGSQQKEEFSGKANVIEVPQEVRERFAAFLTGGRLTVEGLTEELSAISTSLLREQPRSVRHEINHELTNRFLNAVFEKEKGKPGASLDAYNDPLLRDKLVMLDLITKPEPRNGRLARLIEPLGKILRRPGSSRTLDKPA